MTEHKKIAIEYQKDQPFITCIDCPWYDKENNFLLPYDESTKKADIDKKLAEHNAKIADIYSQTLTKVKEKSVIKWLGKEIWKVEYFHDGKNFSDVFARLKIEEIEKIWQNITKKIVGKY